MEWVEYTVANITWSVGGLLIGYSLGKTERTVTWLRDRFEREDREGRS